MEVRARFRPSGGEGDTESAVSADSGPPLGAQGGEDGGDDGGGEDDGADDDEDNDEQEVDFDATLDDLTPEERQSFACFELAIGEVFDKWTILKLASEMTWGGE